MTQQPRILIAEDEERLRRLLAILLGGRGYQLATAEDGAEAWRLFQEGRFDLVITDIRMPQLDGIELLRRVKERSPDIPVLVITAFGSIESAVDAMREGAIDYLPKPFEEQKLHLAVDRALAIRSILTENVNLRREMRSKYNLEHIVAESRPMRLVMDMVRQVAATNATVLVLGESGTGKELVTRAIHEQSRRARGPFVAINCAAIADNLLESELFGHERGSFTGATDRRAGKFEMASGGTLFMDEIAEMSLEMQAKVLRAIETQEIERVGGSRPVRVDLRIIAATNKDLRREVERGDFREDLFFRVNVFPILLPPLRDRREDILPLALFFLRKFAEEMGRRMPCLSASAERMLVEHLWPGNVRELRNTIERVSILLEGNEIRGSDVAAVLQPPGGVVAGSGRASGTACLAAGGFSLDDHERTLLMEALSRAGGNKSRAAKLLGISRAKLRYRLEKFGIRDDDALSA